MIAAFLWAWGCWLFGTLKAVGGLCWLCKIGVAGGAWVLRGMRASRAGGGVRTEGGL